MAWDWKTIVLILTPLVLLPLPLCISGAEARAGYCVLIIIVYWVTQVVPLAVSSLLPVVIFPFMDIMSTSEVCALYFKDSNFVLFGGVTLALGVEKSNLHRRIALKSILLFGTNPRWLMLGLMLIGMLLSFWIPNTGVTAMLIPIVESVMKEIFPDVDADESVRINGDGESPANRHRTDLYRKRVRTTVLLSVAYSVSIAGTGTLIGSGTPIAMKGIVDGLYGPLTGLNFTTWMVIGVPVAVINTFLTWIWLQTFLGQCSQFCAKEKCSWTKDKDRVPSSSQEQYKQLGPMTYHEKSIIGLFSLLILLCFFKNPKFIPGWQSLLPENKHRIGDASVSVALVFLAFVLPSTKPDFWFCKKTRQSDAGSLSAEARSSNSNVLDWKYVQQKFPWSNIFLLGGCYSVSEASKLSGLTYLIGNQLTGLKELPPMLVMLLVCAVGAILTEFSANSAAASILLPIVAQIAEDSKINPLYLIIPVTITCAYAFMFPMGTPSNAMVFTAGQMESADMIKPGMLMKVFSVLVACGVTEIIGTAVLDLHNYPVWAIDRQQTQMP